MLNISLLSKMFNLVRKFNVFQEIVQPRNIHLTNGTTSFEMQSREIKRLREEELSKRVKPREKPGIVHFLSPKWIFRNDPLIDIYLDVAWSIRHVHSEQHVPPSSFI